MIAVNGVLITNISRCLFQTQDFLCRAKWRAKEQNNGFMLFFIYYIYIYFIKMQVSSIRDHLDEDFKINTSPLKNLLLILLESIYHIYFKYMLILSADSSKHFCYY